MKSKCFTQGLIVMSWSFGTKANTGSDEITGVLPESTNLKILEFFAKNISDSQKAFFRKLKSIKSG